MPGPLPPALLLVGCLLCACSAEGDDFETGETDIQPSDDDDDPPYGRFACGTLGGTCRVGRELCVVEDEDMCSRCIELPQPCEANQECSCVPDLEAVLAGVCADAPRCEPRGGGLEVRCAADQWTCG